MTITFNTSDRDPDSWTAELVAAPVQGDLVIRRDRVYCVSRCIHTLSDRDLGSRIRVVVDPLRLDAADVVA